VRALGGERVGLDAQRDTYFAVPRGRLKLRESSLSGAQLIPYLRPDGDGARRSDYRVIPVPDAEGTRRLLAELLGVHRVVTKQREIFLVGNVRVHLDRVDGLGSFLELEAVFDGSPAAEPGEHAKVGRLLAELGVRDADLVPTSYEALLGA
jgi:predicted adenylyl cyclase CyaB